MSTDLDNLSGGLDTAREEAERYGREVERLTNERRAALLSGDDDVLTRIEADLIVAGRERERASLRADDLERRWRAADHAARTAAREAEKRELIARCRERLQVAERIDALLAELGTAVADWQRRGLTLHSAWLTRFADEFGPIRSQFIGSDDVILRGAVPPALALALGGRPASGHPLVRRDPAATAIAKLESGPAPRLVAQPQPAGGASIAHLDDRAGTRAGDPAA